MNALEVVKGIVERHRLDEAGFTLYSHGLHVDPPDALPPPVQIIGRGLRRLQLENLERYLLADDHVVSISSRVDGPGTERHLALMDLHLGELVPYEFVSEAARAFCAGRGSWRLLHSGRHHHLYGDFLLDGDGWRRWNLQALTPLVLTDPRYVWRSMAWECNLLRLNAGRTSRTIAPHTVDPPPGSVPRTIATAALRLALRHHTWRDVRHGKPAIEHFADVADLAMSIWMGCRERGTASDAESTPEELLACAYLHACLDETGTDYDDVHAAAGERVAEWVSRLSRDKREPESKRHAAYEQRLGEASLPARIVKLADLLAELRGLDDQDIVTATLGHLHHVQRQLYRIRDGLEACPEFTEADRLVGRLLTRLARSVRPSI